jgi:hypothetical protein
MKNCMVILKDFQLTVCYRPPFSQGMDTFIIDHVTSSMVSPHKGTLDERETEHRSKSISQAFQIQTNCCWTNCMKLRLSS